MIPEKKDVVIIGNGPSAITLSYFLDGNWPFYTSPHPNEELHAKLVSLSLLLKDQQQQQHEEEEERIEEEEEEEEEEEQIPQQEGTFSTTMSQHSCPSPASVRSSPSSCILSSFFFRSQKNPNPRSSSIINNKSNKVPLQEDSLPPGSRRCYRCSPSPPPILDSWGDKSLVRSNLGFISAGLEGRSINPVSVLLDTLQHPDADFGSDLPSCLTWRRTPGKQIDHVVLGQGDVGGSWSRMGGAGCEDILTVSFASWMQLPDCQVTGTTKGTSGKRINFGNLAKYYKNYIQQKGLDKYFRNFSVVTGVKFHERPKTWTVSGWQEGKGPFEYVTHRVVLATGNSDCPNRLNVEGEDLAFVLHSISDMDPILKDARNRCLDESVVIVGSGLSAADAILTCKQYGVPVKHVFRRHPEDPALIFNQLPENLYPEYHEVHDQMKGSLVSTAFEYKTFPMHSVFEIRENREVVVTNLLSTAEGSAPVTSRTTIKASYVLILIGRRPDLTFISRKRVRDQLPVLRDEPLNPRSNPIRIDPYSHRCPSLPGLYAMGPLVGDNFVRFVQGAALAITNDIWSDMSPQESDQGRCHKHLKNHKTKTYPIVT